MPRPGRRNRFAAQPLHILDLTTTHWVDSCWLAARRREIKIHVDGYSDLPNELSIKNAARFREYLLRVHQGGGELQLKDFATPRVLQDKDPLHLSPFNTFPAEVDSWCKKGRRLYRIDRSLQTLLRLTSLSNVQWEHVRWPFDSFAIELSQPIADPAGKVWDFILVSTYNNEDILLAGEDGPVLQMSFFSRVRSKYDPMQAPDKQKLERLIAQGQWGQAAHLALQLDERLHRPVVIPRSVFRYHKAKLTGLVTDTAQRWRDELAAKVTAAIPLGAYEVWDAMIRIVVGLALYLKTLPAGSKQITTVNKPRREGLPDATIITDHSQIFTVSSVIPLTTDELKFEDLGQRQQEGGTARYEMRTHWRQGYWSRKPGEGNDPAAEKSVWHRPTLVRADRLPKDLGLPCGAVTEDQPGG